MTELKIFHDRKGSKQVLSFEIQSGAHHNSPTRLSGLARFLINNLPYEAKEHVPV